MYLDTAPDPWPAACESWWDFHPDKATQRCGLVISRAGTEDGVRLHHKDAQPHAPFSRYLQ